MSMMFFAQTGCPSRFAYPDEHRVRGLNAEAIARVFLPAPPWLLAAEYAPLRLDGDGPPASLFFSRNLSLYVQPVVDTDWSEHWFFMNGRVHPYVLAWEVERRDGLEAGNSDTVIYTMPALVVRDQSYQASASLPLLRAPLVSLLTGPIPSVLPRLLTSSDQFPSTSPAVYFHGVVAGAGLSLLCRDLLPGLDDSQLRCCGFVQLTTYLAHGVPDKIPYKGFHPFQVFVIFPIHLNP